MINYIIKKYGIKNENPEDLSVRKRLGMLSGLVGIFGNLLLFSGKFFAGVITSSIAISADAFNNLSDAISSLVTLICFKASNNPADKDHPFGYGRIEYISGLIVSIAIIFMGIEFTKSSIEKIFNPEPVSIQLLPALILIFSLFIKILLGVFNTKIGKIINSTALKAATFDSLGDAAVTVTILFGMAITYFTGISVDAYSGILVSLFIIFTGVGLIKETLSPLIGQSPDPEFVKEITDLVLSSPNIIGIHELTVHNYGPGKSMISMHAEMPAEKNIIELHEEIDLMEKKLKEKFGCSAIIHMDPIVTSDVNVQLIREKISSLVKMIHENAKVYDLRIVPGDKVNLIFHVSVPYDMPKTDEEIKSSLSLGIKTLDESYESQIEVDRVYFEDQAKTKDESADQKDE
ncbi:MAG: cation transporter [Clostridia bacterium]|nr:cation transporter [Clostridia bacterium]